MQHSATCQISYRKVNISRCTSTTSVFNEFFPITQIFLNFPISPASTRPSVSAIYDPTRRLVTSELRAFSPQVETASAARQRPEDLFMIDRLRPGSDRWPSMLEPHGRAINRGMCNVGRLNSRLAHLWARGLCLRR